MPAFTIRSIYYLCNCAKHVCVKEKLIEILRLGYRKIEEATIFINS